MLAVNGSGVENVASNASDMVRQLVEENCLIKPRKKRQGQCPYADAGTVGDCYYTNGASNCVADITYTNQQADNERDCPKVTNCSSAEACEKRCDQLGKWLHCNASRCRDKGTSVRLPSDHAKDTENCPRKEVPCMRPDGECERYSRGRVNGMYVGVGLLSVLFAIIAVVMIGSVIYAYIKKKPGGLFGKKRDQAKSVKGGAAETNLSKTFFSPITMISPPSLTTTPSDALIKKYASAKTGESKSIAPKNADGAKSIRSASGASKTGRSVSASVKTAKTAVAASKTAAVTAATKAASKTAAVTAATKTASPKSTRAKSAVASPKSAVKSARAPTKSAAASGKGKLAKK